MSLSDKMDNLEQIKIVTFYEFKRIAGSDLTRLRADLRTRMRELNIRGTIILAPEGFNATVCGSPEDIDRFTMEFEELLDTALEMKASFHDSWPFRRVDVKIKPEIVTLKKEVDIALGAGTHVSPAEWNKIISDEKTILIDARNDYEFQTGTFSSAINPKTRHFSELPEFVNNNLDPERHRKIAMFCTGGIRCEKFAPYMKQLGFENVYQLRGGILKYLEEVGEGESLWNGECFVFDSRISVDSALYKGSSPDHSQRDTE
jgi:UPF0176 protein